MPSSARSPSQLLLHSFPTRRSSDLFFDLHSHLPDCRQDHGRKSGALVCLDVGTSPLHLVLVDSLGLGHDHHTAHPQSDFPGFSAVGRSEEHTSELQSPMYLVCRLLLAHPPSSCYTLSLHDALPISSLTCIPIYLIAGRTMGEKVARWSVWTWALLPYTWYWSIHWVWDTTITPLILSLIFLVSLQLEDRKSTRLNSSHRCISYAVFCSLTLPALATLFPYTTLFRSLL